MAFEVGDRVSRQIHIGQKERKVGTILRKYKATQSSFSSPFWLYAVRFDEPHDRGEEVGFLESGLEKV